MTTLCKVQIAWSGPQVIGGGVTTLYFSGSDTSPAPGALVAAFDAAKAYFPLGVSVTVPNSGDKIDDTTGHLTGVWSATGGANVAFTGDNHCAAGAGACIAWTTGGIVNGSKGPRKLRGRTFLVPLSTNCYDIDGTLNAAAMGALGTLANSIQASGPLAIWHRPSTPGGTDGNSYGVISNRVRDKVAILRSRRD